MFWCKSQSVCSGVRASQDRASQDVLVYPAYEKKKEKKNLTGAPPHLFTDYLSHPASLNTSVRKMDPFRPAEKLAAFF
ncbi:hypothetical protein ACOMHN_050892 [Nucella lapillus]